MESASSPWQPASASNITLDRFIEDYELEEHCSQIVGLGWTPADGCPDKLTKDLALFQVIFGSEHLAWKPAPWRRFVRAAAHLQAKTGSN